MAVARGAKHIKLNAIDQFAYKFELFYSKKCPRYREHRRVAMAIYIFIKCEEKKSPLSSPTLTAYYIFRQRIEITKEKKEKKRKRNGYRYTVHRTHKASIAAVGIAHSRHPIPPTSQPLSCQINKTDNNIVYVTVRHFLMHNGFHRNQCTALSPLEAHASKGLTESGRVSNCAWKWMRIVNAASQ